MWMSIAAKTGAIEQLCGQVPLEVRRHRWGGLFLLQKLEKLAALLRREVKRMIHTPGSLSRKPRFSGWTRAFLTASLCLGWWPSNPNPTEPPAST